MKFVMFTLVLCFGYVYPSAFSQELELGSAFGLPGPPSRGSAQDVADYETVLNYQNTRTPAECARTLYESKIALLNFFAAPYGPLNRAEALKWQAFVDQHNTRAKLTIVAAKVRFHRQRPYRAHSDIHPCVNLEVDFSYPSGHSTLAEFYGRILSIAFPERATAIGNRAAQIAIDRSLAGVHYPSDVRDGLLLGDQIFDTENEDGKLEALIHANFF